MVDYLTDIHVTEEWDISLDSANDLALVSGVENLEQSTALTTGDVISRAIGGRATAENLALLEQRIETRLDNDPHIEDVIRVRTESVNRQSGVIRLSVLLDSDETFTIEVGN